MIRFYDGNLFLEVIARNMSEFDYMYLRDDTNGFTNGLKYDAGVNAYLVDDIQIIINQTNEWFHTIEDLNARVLVAGVGPDANGNLLEIRNARWVSPYEKLLTGREIWSHETSEWIMERKQDDTVKLPQTEYVEWNHGLYSSIGASWNRFGNRPVDHLPWK